MGLWPTGAHGRDVSPSRHLLLPVDVLLTPATHSLSLTPTDIIPMSLPVRQLQSRFCMRKNSWVAFLLSVPHPAARAPLR